MHRLERPAPSVFNARQDPLARRPTPRRRRYLPPEDPQAVAQDYLQYMLNDYEARRRQAHRSWRDLCPAYAFALTTHAANWPRLRWQTARTVVEDAWVALDHMPASALRPLLQ
jgi:hypothetical protein